MTKPSKPMIFEEVEVLLFVQMNTSEGFSVRQFKTPSESEEGLFYYIQAVKQTKDPWDRAILLCNCKSAQFSQALAVMGDKATCKHSKNLRAVLKSGEVAS